MFKSLLFEKQYLEFWPFKYNDTANVWIVALFYVQVYGKKYILNKRKSEQGHIPHAPTLLENVVYNEWQFQLLVTGNRTENQFHLSCTK